MPDRPTAEIRDASVKRETAFNPATLGDSCIMCPNKIGESDPRRVVRSKMGTMMLMHLGCADRYERGERPASVAEKPKYTPRNLNFMSFGELQTYIVERGIIPATSRVTLSYPTPEHVVTLQEGKREGNE